MTIAKLSKDLFGVTLDSEAKLRSVFDSEIEGAQLTYADFVECVRIAKGITNPRSPLEIKMAANWGETTTEAALIKILTQKAIEKQQPFLTEGIEAISVTRMDDLEAKRTTHERGTATYPVAEGAQAGRQVLIWNKWQVKLEMAEYEFAISDQAKIRGEAVIQQRTGLREAGYAIALQRRNNIIDTLYAGPTNSAAKTAVWNGASADIMLDMALAYGSILDNSEDIPLPIIDAGLYCVIPAVIAGHIKDYRDASTPGISHARQVQEAFNIKWVPTRHWDASLLVGIQDDALVLVKSPLVAEHGILQTGIVPLVETERERARGQVWTIRDFFGTKVVPSAWSTPSTPSTLTNTGIYKITDVV